MPLIVLVESTRWWLPVNPRCQSDFSDRVMPSAPGSALNAYWGNLGLGLGDEPPLLSCWKWSPSRELRGDASRATAGRARPHPAGPDRAAATARAHRRS